ncbi:MAG: TonB-dependent receptor, partial [Burkholderiales bacterium]|nr:TonB-dependent receptor [Burkholderiales bacterium]
GYAPTANAADGFTESLDDQDSLSGRLEGLYRFSSHMSWLMTVDGTHNQGAGQAAYVITPGSLPTSRAQTPQVQGSVNDSGLGVTSEFKADLGFADFTYLFGHRKTTRDDILTNGPAPSTYAPYSDAFMQNSHELRLTSARAGRLQWVAGLYYFKEVGSNINLAVLLPPAFGGGLAIQFIQNPAISQSKAVFGQATYALAPDWRATLGLRSNADAKSRVGETIGGNGKPIGNIGNLAHGTWNKLTYKLGVEHDLAGGQMAYATFATGYKAGGYNDGNGVVGDPNYNPSLYYKPETITSTEAGVKGHYFDHRLELGISAFHYAYTDLQVGGVVNNSLVTLNAAKAAVDGLEFEGRAIVGEDGMLNFALGTLNARYNQYSAPDGSSLSGQALDRAPKATLTLGYTQNWDLQGGSRISATLGTRYSSSYRLTDPGTATRAPLSFIQKANTNSSVSVAYWGANQKWHAEIYGKSLENTIRINSIASVNGTDYGYLAEPRTFGVRGVFSF